jgi:hypothetical protein
MTKVIEFRTFAYACLSEFQASNQVTHKLVASNSKVGFCESDTFDRDRNINTVVIILAFIIIVFSCFDKMVWVSMYRF